MMTEAQQDMPQGLVHPKKLPAKLFYAMQTSQQLNGILERSTTQQPSDG